MPHRDGSGHRPWRRGRRRNPGCGRRHRPARPGAICHRRDAGCGTGSHRWPGRRPASLPDRASGPPPTVWPALARSIPSGPCRPVRVVSVAPDGRTALPAPAPSLPGARGHPGPVGGGYWPPRSCQSRSLRTRRWLLQPDLNQGRYRQRVSRRPTRRKTFPRHLRSRHLLPIGSHRLGGGGPVVRS